MVDATIERPPFFQAIGLTFEGVVRNARECAVLSIIYAILTAVPNAVLAALGPDIDFLQLTGAEVFALFAFAIAAFGTLVVVGLLVYPGTVGALSLVGEATVTKQTVELGIIARRALLRALPATGALVLVLLISVAPALLIGLVLVAVGFLTGSALVFGLAALVTVGLMIPAVYVIVRTSLAIPAVVTERLGPTDAIRRSWELTAGAFWWLVGVFLFVSIVVSMVGLVVSTITGAVGGSGIAPFGLIALGNTVTGMVTVSVGGVALGVVYAARAIPPSHGFVPPAPVHVLPPPEVAPEHVPPPWDPGLPPPPPPPSGPGEPADGSTER